MSASLRTRVIPIKKCLWPKRLPLLAMICSPSRSCQLLVPGMITTWLRERIGANDGRLAQETQGLRIAGRMFPREADDEGWRKIFLAGAVGRGVRNAMSPVGTKPICLR